MTTYAVVESPRTAILLTQQDSANSESPRKTFGWVSFALSKVLNTLPLIYFIIQYRELSIDFPISYLLFWQYRREIRGSLTDRSSEID